MTTLPITVPRDSDRWFYRDMVQGQVDDVQDVLEYHDRLADCDEEIDKSLKWFLCNSRHWCEANKIDWNELNQDAQRMYEEERESVRSERVANRKRVQ